MKSETQEAVRLAAGFGAGPIDEDWVQVLDEISTKLVTAGTGTLESFAIRHLPKPNGRDATELISAGPDIPAPVLRLANSAWQWCDGVRDANRARLVISASREEFARAAFNSLLWRIGAGAAGFLGVKNRADEIRERLLSLNWADADHFARENGTQLLLEDGGGGSFFEWCEQLDSEHEQYVHRQRTAYLGASPPITSAELGVGLALTWIDQAMQSPASAAGLIADAAQVLYDAGFLAGYEGRLGVEEEDATSFAKRGANAAHRENRQAKQLVIATYRSGTYRSKDRAAEEMAGKLVPYSVRTVRGWLTKA
jgi:hypothetical protein